MRALTLWRVLALLVMVTATVSGGVMAQQADSAITPRAPDVRMVVDVSGSMKQNDPQNLRANALGFAAALLPSSATSAVWTFGTTVDNPLRTGAVDASWRELANRLAPQLTDYQQFTDIERALRRVADGDIASSNNAVTDRNRHLILLTDGMVDLPSTGGDKARQDAASRQRILQELAPRLAREGIVVHTIGLSDNVDRALLEQTAQRTDGLAAVARTPEALLRAFLDVLDRILPGDRVPLDADQRFAIDDDIDQFNALLFHAPEQAPPVLIGPSGERYSRESHPGQVEWLSNDRYDLIRVPEPATGEWRVEGEIGEDSRIGIQAGIALRSNDLPATLYQNLATPLTVWLEEKGEALHGEALPPGLRVRAELRDLDGNVLSQVTLAPTPDSSDASSTREPGRFQGELTGIESLGNARLAVIAESERLTRERVQAVNVVTALEARLSDDGRRIVVRANHPDLDTRNTELSAVLTGQALDVRQSGEREWTIAVPETDPSASLPVTITAEARLEGRRLRFELPVVRLNPGAAVGLGGADAPRGVQIESRMEGGTPSPEEDAAFDFGDGMTPAQMLEYAKVRAREGWALAKPYVDDYVIPYAQRPVTWLVIALVLVLVLLWRANVAAKRRRRRTRRAEPSLRGGSQIE